MKPKPKNRKAAKMERYLCPHCGDMERVRCLCMSYGDYATTRCLRCNGWGYLWRKAVRK